MASNTKRPNDADVAQLLRELAKQLADVLTRAGNAKLCPRGLLAAESAGYYAATARRAADVASALEEDAGVPCPDCGKYGACEHGRPTTDDDYGVRSDSFEMKVERASREIAGLPKHSGPDVIRQIAACALRAAGVEG